MMNSMVRVYDSRHHRWTQSLMMLLLLTVFISTAQAKEKPYPGELYDIGTHRLHMHCIGQGSPTVIIDSGAGGFSLEWIKIQNNLAEYSQVGSYDRAGYGFSDPGPVPRTSAQITFELHRLLDEANISGPYVMVGHSFGGYNIRYFATLYPDEVAGMVLVDASHPQQFNTEEFKRVSSREADPYKRPKSVRVRMMRPVMADNYPQENSKMAYMLMLTLKARMTLLDELDNMEYSAHQLLQHEEFKAFDFPVVVITRGKRVWPHTTLGDKREEQWMWLQRDLANISTQSYHFVAKNSGHIVHLDEPELVSSNILFALDRARTYRNEKELIEKYDIRLAHYGTIDNSPIISPSYVSQTIADSGFFVMDKHFQQVLFNSEIEQIQTRTDNLLY